MARVEKKPFILESLLITDVSSDGRAVGRQDGKVVFVEYAVPGDVADVMVYKKKKSFAEGNIAGLKERSEKRQEAFCSHFGVCGGCKWQNMKYDSQLYFKQKQVTDALSRIGHLELPEITPILASAKTQFYRNKLEFTFSNKRWLTKTEMQDTELTAGTPALGFHIPQRYDKVLDIEKCYLQTDPSNAIRLEVKKFALENELSFFDLRAQQGMLRNLIIRTSSTGELMVILVFFEEDKNKREGLLNHLSGKFPEITSLQFVINSKQNDTLFDQEIKVFKGKDFITEEMEGLKFRVSAKSFFQTNSEQALELYRIARSLADLQGNEIVYDLYTGTGTIACFVAAKAAKVVGIDNVPEAIANAGINAKENNIENAVFYSGDLGKTMTDEFIRQNGKPDVIITDPPRSGMNPDVVKKICEIAPEKIVYVSCNAATQARDLALMSELYTIVSVQPVDMFPQTHHVENVVLLRKK